MICGTRGIPDTVAPFRAWRGSRDLVAQSPKFHAAAVASVLSAAKLSLSHRSYRDFKRAHHDEKYSAAKIPTMRVLQSLTLRLSLFFDE